jgi:small subunit ribosomal protein S3
VGQKVHPKGFRISAGYRDWDAAWFARDSYGKQAIEDVSIRRYIDKTLEKADIACVKIEKAGDNVKVIIFSGRPGVIIGKKGQDIEALRSGLAKHLKRPTVEVSVQEVAQPELDAMLVAKNIAAQLERRASHKQAMKRASMSAMRSGAKGINIRVAGRIGGAEIAREEWLRVGSVPRHTLRADIDYALALAHTTYGVIGVKVWICRGEYQHSA